MSANAKSIRQQFADTMLEVGVADSRLVVLLGDISHFIMQPFAKACPGRFYNVGICEPAIVTMAAGLNKVGLIPVAHTIAPFLLERSYEQMKIDFGYHKLYGNLVSVGSAFDYANLGCTHHCYTDFALMKSIEGAQICFTASSIEFDALFKQSYDNQALTLYRIPGKDHNLNLDRKDIQFGKCIKICEGKDITLISTGPTISNMMMVREKLLADGISSEVIYVHTVRPLDVESILSSVSKTKKVLIAEEHMLHGGLGMDVLFAARHIPGAQFQFACIGDSFVRGYGKYEDHCAAVGLDVESLYRKAKNEFSYDNMR